MITFFIGFSVGAMLVASLFAIYYIRIENKRADAEYHEIWGDHN